MLATYKYVPHQMERMQEFIDFIVYEVWCRAPGNGPFRLELFDGSPDLQEVMAAFNYGHTAGGDFFYGHIERIYGHFAGLAPAQIDQFIQWHQANNDIERACANDPAVHLTKYANIALVHCALGKELAAFFKQLYSQQLLDLVALREKIGDIDDHYQHFMAVNVIGKCPFCGISDMQGVYHTKREAYDHYLPKALYPFNSMNFKNLVPACHHCNSTYKSSQDPAYTPKDPAHAAVRRKVFYPYANPGHSIELSIDINNADVDRLSPADIQLGFGPHQISEEIETWKDIYGIDERYKAKCCSGDAKDWLEQVRILRDSHGLSSVASLNTFQKQAKKSPLANSNFIKTAFLEGCQRAGILNAIDL